MRTIIYYTLRVRLMMQVHCPRPHECVDTSPPDPCCSDGLNTESLADWNLVRKRDDFYLKYEANKQ